MCILSCSIPKEFQLKPKTEPVVFLELFLCYNISAAAGVSWIRTTNALVSVVLMQRWDIALSTISVRLHNT